MYGELNYYGLVFTRQSLQLRDSQYESEKKGIFINYGDIVWTLGRSLKLAQDFFQWTTYSGNLVVTVKFSNIFKRNLRYTADDRINEDFTCSEREFSLSEDTATEYLKDGFVSFICLFMKHILWAFNCEPKELERKVLELLQGDRLA